MPRLKSAAGSFSRRNAMSSATLVGGSQITGAPAALTAATSRSDQSAAAEVGVAVTA